MFTGNFIGRCGKDAKVLQGINGEFVTLDIAENYYSKGETKTRWIRVRCGTPRAVKMAKYWTKGRQLEIVGELVDVNIYEDSQGKPQYQMVVNAFRIEFVDSGKKRNPQENSEQTAAQPTPVSDADRQTTPTMPFEAPADTSDDLPF